MNKAIALIVIVLVVVAGWLLLRNTAVDTGLENLNPETNSETGSDSGDVQTTGNVYDYTISGSTFEFSPKEIIVNKGDTLNITFANREGIHDWVLDEFNVKTKQLQAGESETITFVADKTGTFEYYCSVGNHRQMGMVGKLIVR